MNSGDKLSFRPKECIRAIMKSAADAARQAFVDAGIDCPLFVVLAFDMDDQNRLVGGGQYISNANPAYRSALADACIDVIDRVVSNADRQQENN